MPSVGMSPVKKTSAVIIIALVLLLAVLLELQLTQSKIEKVEAAQMTQTWPAAGCDRVGAVAYIDKREQTLMVVYCDFGNNDKLDFAEGYNSDRRRTRYILEDDASEAINWNGRSLVHKYYDGRFWYGRGTEYGELLQRQYDEVRRAFKEQEEQKNKK
jgi:hypothetical protein